VWSTPLISNSPTPPVATPIVATSQDPPNGPVVVVQDRNHRRTTANPPRHGFKIIFAGCPRRLTRQENSVPGHKNVRIPGHGRDEWPLSGPLSVRSHRRAGVDFSHFAGPIAKRTWHSRGRPPCWRMKRSNGHRQAQHDRRIPSGTPSLRHPLRTEISPRDGADAFRKTGNTMGRWPGQSAMPVHLHSRAEVCVGEDAAAQFVESLSGAGHRTERRFRLGLTVHGRR
jgi:hypothetical protein